MNKKIKSIIAVIMVAVTLFSAAALPVSAEKAESDNLFTQITGIRTYKDKYENGFESEPLDGIIKAFDSINTVTKVLTGRQLFDEEKLEFKAEGFVDEILNDLAANSFFDGYEIADNIPLAVSSSERIIKLFRIDLDTVIPQLQQEVNDYSMNGEVFKFVVTELLVVYLRQLKEVNIYQEQVSDNVYRAYAEITYNYGGTDRLDLDLYYNTETQQLYSTSGKGIFDLGFNFDNSSNTLYAVTNCWQRSFGFRLAYDFIAKITVMDYDTERVKFTYNNKEWMIQLWKGRYFMCPGAELGVYNREIGSFGSYYNCASDDEMMNMSIELYHNDDLIFKEGPMLHWWITGFNVGEKYYLPESLTMKGTIEFPTEEMATLFTNSANTHKRLSVEQDGVNVSYTFK